MRRWYVSSSGGMPHAKGNIPYSPAALRHPAEQCDELTQCRRGHSRTWDLQDARTPPNSAKILFA
jgi:hypothetical protein